MFFRLPYTLKPMDMGDEKVLDFIIKNEAGDVSIKVKKVSVEDDDKTYPKGDISAIAFVERKLSDKQTMLFESMDKEVPAGIDQRIAELAHELAAAIEQAVKLFRWRRGVADVHNFIKYGAALQYSFDNKVWIVCPGQIRFGVAAITFPKKSLVEECNRLLAEKTTEPLGHELFCEAWSQRNTNPRSSLIIGIAAAETGFKDCLVSLKPDTAWLISNIASPSLIKMLKEYLPALPVKFKINNKVMPPPAQVLNNITDGISIRNNIAHGKPINITPEKLEKVLSSIRELLYLLDVYCGQKWAWEFISSQCREELQVKSK